MSLVNYEDDTLEVFNDVKNKFFASLDWERVLTEEKILQSRNVLNNELRFAHKGTYISVQKNKNATQKLFFDGKEVLPSRQVAYSGPTASGVQANNAQVYENAARSSKLLANLSLERPYSETYAASELIKRLAGNNTINQFVFIDKHGQSQKSTQWESILNQFPKTVQWLSSKAEGLITQGQSQSQAPVQNQAQQSFYESKVNTDNYFGLEREAINKQLIRIINQEGYKRFESKSVKPDVIRNIKNQVDFFKIIEDYTSQKPQRIDGDMQFNDKGKFAVDCPFSPKGSGYKMIVNKTSWFSENPNVKPELLVGDEERATYDVVTFIQMKRDISFSQAVEVLAEKANYKFKPTDYASSERIYFKKGKETIEIIPGENGMNSFVKWPTPEQKVAGQKPLRGGTLEFLSSEKKFSTSESFRYMHNFFKEKWQNQPEEMEAFYDLASSRPGSLEAMKDERSLIGMAYKMLYAMQNPEHETTNNHSVANHQQEEAKPSKGMRV